MCPCSSGLEFSSCCGANDTLPKGVVIKRNVIPDSVCDKMVSYLDQQPKAWLSVFDKASPEELPQYMLDKETRIAQGVKQGKLRKVLEQTVRKHLTTTLRDEYDKTLIWFESPEVMYYQAGGRYIPHADSENMIGNTGFWRRMFDRDYSLLLYLSEDFEGGSLLFNRFGFRYQPRKGDLVLFPSDNRYLHEAEPVTAGHRYAVVSWCSVKEGTRDGKRAKNRIMVGE